MTSLRTTLAAWLGALALPLLPVVDAAAPPPAASAIHWAYRPLSAPVPPACPDGDCRTAIDRFIRARLAADGLRPNPEADRRTLIRRVTFDLTGLPPSPAEVAAFVADASSDAYERLVDRLLASPAYGERWARHWMDAVHFAETHGHDQDRIRTNAWPYRDYLVDSLNRDKPYARFVAEQVAGDALFPEDPSATVALGLVAAGPWDESSLRDIREDTLDRQIGRYLDRDDMVTTVMQTFASTTVQCARCHDHKFDPISQQDYYSLQAVFSGVDRANRAFDPDPRVHQRRQALIGRRAAIQRDEPAIAAELATPSAGAATVQWEQALNSERIEWHTITPAGQASSEGATLAVADDGSILSTGRKPEKDVVTVVADLMNRTVSAIRLEVLPDPVMPKNGPGRSENGNFHLSEIELWVAPADHGEFRRIALRNPSADFNQDGWGIARAIDDDPATAWGIHPAEGRPHEAAFELAEPVGKTGPVTLLVVLRQVHGGSHLMGRFRLSTTEHAAPVRIHSFPDAIAKILGTPAAQRSPADRVALTKFRALQQVEDELATLPTAAHVYAAASDFVPDGSLVPTKSPRPVRVLKRGEITKPGEPAGPGTLSCVAGLPNRFPVSESAPESTRRAALARWLVDRENPLVWRSIVNRVWLLHFGRGIVDTPNDFGRMGSAPTHPELLDWLAVWFRDDARGSLKQLHRLIVTSASYRQSSAMTAETPAARVDQDNRLLWRMNRTRLDAEQIRDAALAVAGRMDRRMGGPSDRQFDLKPGIHVTPLVDYTRFDPDSAAGNRRSAYRFLFRTLPDPFMDALDCPAGDQLTAVRNSSVTVQQALALWNNVFIARQAEHLATRLLREASEDRARIRTACELVFSREPTPDEAADFETYVRRHGLANFCRLLFNANEFIFVD